jgi:type 1 glutamine amidotransferase
MLLHFACGAWPDWPQFRELAGRVYDPKLRPHDPHGPFRIEIADPNHPITRGLTPFETTDELYTCLTGTTLIHPVVTARSKVDGKDYPMAFVLHYGKGRVFHTVLGHDVQALTNSQVPKLLRHGCDWVAEIPVNLPESP